MHMKCLYSAFLASHTLLCILYSHNSHDISLHKVPLPHHAVTEPPSQSCWWCEHMTSTQKHTRRIFVPSPLSHSTYESLASCAPPSSKTTSHRGAESRLPKRHSKYWTPGNRGCQRSLQPTTTSSKMGQHSDIQLLPSFQIRICCLDFVGI